MVVDVGTGDGAFVVRTAAGDPSTFVIGIDTSVAGLGAGYSRARRRRLPNALFVLAAAEDSPVELAGTATELHVQFPWGSLLRGIVGPDPVLARSLASLLGPEGQMTVSLSIVARDGVDGVEALDEGGATTVAASFAAAAGLVVSGVESVTAVDVADMHSSWAKRLGVGRSRPGFRLRFRVPG